MNPIERIASALSYEERLCQMAEEAAELSQAASKLARILRGDNPTPVSSGKAYDNLLEEIADVLVCCKVLKINKEDVTYTEYEKLFRWAKRLEEMEES